MQRYGWCGLLVLLVGAMVGLGRAQAAPPGPSWQDTGISVAPPSGNACIDPTQRDTFLLSYSTGQGRGAESTMAVNWRTGQQTQVSSRAFGFCTEAGWLYGIEDGGFGRPYRFSQREPSPQYLAHQPTEFARDGSALIYSLIPPLWRRPDTGLWASSDGGLTWAARTPPFVAQIQNLLVAAADARVVYALVLMERPPDSSQNQYLIYASTDAGATWDLRSPAPIVLDYNEQWPRVFIAAVGGPASPVDLLEQWIDYGSISKYQHRVELLLSDDGGRTFRSLGINTLPVGRQLVYTHEGILRLEQQYNPGNPDPIYYPPGAGPITQTLTLSRDGGRSWESLGIPPAAGPGMPREPYYMATADVAPANVFLYNAYDPMWYSPDGGHSWQQVADHLEGTLYISPYLPLTALAIVGGGYIEETPGAPPATGTPEPPRIALGRLYALDLPNAGRYQTAAAAPNHAPGSRYFPAPSVSHNVPEVFLRYWEAQGGLAQFGYPRTEAFREVSPADGQVYLVQYFERNRLEYHPEHAGTAFAVLLGLLGNEQTAARRAAGEAPFQPVADPQQADVPYFAATGHTLREPFVSYWQSHGGLALYGYPISEPFAEVNPDDGRSYTVQYFERNRFEYHPENRGSPYEVLLGLLGNTLLREKGW